MPEERVPEDGLRACSRCGTGGTGPADGLPLGWSVSSERGGLAFLCAACTRAVVRGIEGRLDEEWWEG